MGRACCHPCETSCNRGKLDQPVSVHAVERFLGDLAIKEAWRFAGTAPATGKRVLIVGAGPSGLSAATSRSWATRSRSESRFLAPAA